MSFKISIPIRLYSTYGDFINAPNGFDIPANQLDKTKWKHFNQNYFISLVIERFGGNRVTLTLTSRENIILDILSTIVGNANNHFKLSCRSPSLSCKYLKEENGSQILKRFQIEFINSTDFSNTLIILKSLSIPIKEFPPIPNTSLSMRDCTLTYPSNNYSIPLAKNYTTLENNSFIEQESQLTTTQMEPYVSSQKSFLTQPNIGVFQNIMCTNDGSVPDNLNPTQKNSDNSILNKLGTPNTDSNNTETLKIITTNNDLHRTNFITPNINAAPLQNQNLMMNKNDLLPSESCSSKTLLKSANENKEIPSITPHKHNYISRDDVNAINPNHNHSKNQLNYLTENVRDKQLAQESALQPSPLVSDNRIIDHPTTISEPKTNTGIIATKQTLTIKETNRSSDKKDRNNNTFNTINSIALLPKTKVKISKRMIRNKLSDRKFMKWVCNFPKFNNYQFYYILFT